jgi:hypothetical protein
MGTKTMKLSFTFGLMLFFVAGYAQNTLPTNSTVDKTKQQAKKDENSRFVYYNYKGITDITLAKQAWVKDHPEEYAKLKQTSYKPANTVGTSTPTSTKPLPNAERRLPRNYDDSKTNINSK